MYCRTPLSNPTLNTLKTYYQHQLLGLFICYQLSRSLFLSILFAGSCDRKYVSMSLTLFSDRSYQLVLVHHQIELYENYCGHALYIASKFELKCFYS